ncbi:Dse1p NDAI_0B02440 [Naumovozyma dairenensis CBS 421]|uniref:Protein DSE1 n=1 Tax=Naumovozyma dairenensis (strain ATCC 10597 / BCRC 20456 / CBS 421 / NBRC 0211 / NRRL Y-12639) TaxID=1071378 RepID=G0W668_NAUDC|nr:hypothetical protein NDAI_0B02440 [Naumovozyma dairenensis CBS 421]CCD23279.1 hypothetical protein NDAI_0B02440 [Naumovozyma dairenensis CBS 421]
MNTEYYEPVTIFRQPAINIKKNFRNSTYQNGIGHNKFQYNKSWQTNTSKMGGSSNLRKVSGDFNDYYTTKKLKSSYWNINHNTNENFNKTIPNSLSINDSTIILSNGDSKDNLKLYNLNSMNNDVNENKIKLQTLQSITVPGTPITTSATISLPHNNESPFILTGHQDGQVNLISTSLTEGNAKIIKRFNHSKYLTSISSRGSTSRCYKSQLDNILNKFESKPIRNLKFKNSNEFISLINDSMFIYDINENKTPKFLQNFPMIESFAINPYHDDVLALCGSDFDNAGISLLDLRKDNDNHTSNNLFTPKVMEPVTRCAINSKSCEWMDETKLFQSHNGIIKVWDIRQTNGETICEIEPNSHFKTGIITSIKYDSIEKKLYSCDEFNNLISWNLQHLEKVKKCVLSYGILPSYENIPYESEEVSECGNFILNSSMGKSEGRKNNSNMMMDYCYDINGLITVDFEELGVHQICDVKCSIQDDKEGYELVEPQLEGEYNIQEIDEDEDVTDSSNETLIFSESYDVSSMEAYEGLVDNNHDAMMVTKKMY